MIIRRNIDGHEDVSGTYVRYEDHVLMLNRMAWDLAKALNYLEEAIEALYVHDVSGEWCVDHEYNPTEAAQFLQTVENTQYEVDMSARARSMREAAPEMVEDMGTAQQMIMAGEYYEAAAFLKNAIAKAEGRAER